MHNEMQIGRTSCSNFWASTFRVVLTAAAYVLMQEMCLHLAPTRYARAQVSTLRERFLKRALKWWSRCVASCCTCRIPSPTSTAFNALLSAWALGVGNCTAAPPPGTFYSSTFCSKYLISCLDLASDLHTELRNSLLFNDFFELLAFGSRPQQTYCHATFHE